MKLKTQNSKLKIITLILFVFLFSYAVQSQVISGSVNEEGNHAYSWTFNKDNVYKHSGTEVDSIIDGWKVVSLENSPVFEVGGSEHLNWKMDTTGFNTDLSSTGLVHYDSIKSPTTTNGFAILNAFYDKADATKSKKINNVYLRSPMLDFTGESNVMLEFYNYFRWHVLNNDLGSNVDGTSLSLQVRTGWDGSKDNDDDTMWKTYDLRDKIWTNTLSANADTVRINISDIVAGEDSVFVRFLAKEVTYYFWAIDDVSFKVAPTNDLVIKNEKVYYDLTVDINQDTIHYASYTKLPKILAKNNNLIFSNDIENFGANQQTSVKSKIDVYKDNNLEETLSVDNSSPMSTGDKFPALFYDIDSYKLSGEKANYRFDFFTDSDFIDVNPNNNRKSFELEVTDTVIALDYGISDDMGMCPCLGNPSINTMSGSKIANTFLITKFSDDTEYNKVKVNSLSVFVHPKTKPGVLFKAELHKSPKLDQSSFLMESANVTIKGSDLGTWLTFPFSTPVYIPEGMYYGSVVFSGGTTGFEYWIGQDLTDKVQNSHFYSNEKVFKNPPTMYRTFIDYLIGNPREFKNLAMIRLNIADSIYSQDASINTIEIENNIKIYPNPFKDFLTAEFYIKDTKTTDITITDITGKVVQNQKLNSLKPNRKHSITINTNKIKKGIYFLNISTDNYSITKKIIQQAD